MFTLPDTFKENNEDYIVINAMKNFLICRPNIKSKLSDSRRVLVKTIVEYANQSETAKEDTLNWVDSVVKEGIKDLYIKGIADDSLAIIRDLEKVNKLVDEELKEIEVNHLCNNKYTDKLKLVRFQVENEDTLIYTFHLCQLVYIYNGEGDEKVRLYPICVEIYPNEGLIVGRAKPRQNMYKYEIGDFDPKNAKKLHSEYRIQHGIQYILDLLKIQCKGTTEISGIFKNYLYKLLDKYTNTPTEIIELITKNKEKIDNVIDEVSGEICVKGNKNDIKADLLNLVEKYFSITYEDKNIFINGKEAYPLRISATDEEESKVDQKSAREHPLQSKALFFDNKKMMQKNKKCDGVIFKFKRKNTKYFDEEFKVKIIVKNNYCYIKFFEYTEEVDIKNVLRLFISA